LIPEKTVGKLRQGWDGICFLLAPWWKYGKTLMVGSFISSVLFVPAAGTPFADKAQGSLELTLFLLSLLRLQEKKVLLPATTALGTIHPLGREMGIRAGANVVMPNLSPVAVRKKYALYDHKICTGEEAAECRGCLNRRMESIGYRIVTDRGDSPYIR
jgi:biotin synthase